MTTGRGRRADLGRGRTADHLATWHSNGVAAKQPVPAQPRSIGNSSRGGRCVAGAQGAKSTAIIALPQGERWEPRRRSRGRSGATPAQVPPPTETAHRRSRSRYGWRQTSARPTHLTHIPPTVHRVRTRRAAPSRAGSRNGSRWAFPFSMGPTRCRGLCQGCRRRPPECPAGENDEGRRPTPAGPARAIAAPDPCRQRPTPERAATPFWSTRTRHTVRPATRRASLASPSSVSGIDVPLSRL